ncbi:hypothetical protein [Pseudonocardia acidicola]|uniref:Glycosyltransferase family 4 protein n=1 Tax=Pseudonocardia acidicola TaxID=2724939 RepID=A0ABX1S9Q2_9PSEU|nr:hypothetical protein [Pseudonocardia acidicola]NMH96979.1 glycosyltransferase family 4 protein [Pseudonocardia acidicola]
MKVLVHAPGPAHHGVVRHAADVARLAAEHGARPVELGAQLTHAQFTDALYGADIASAADAFTAWARSAPRPLVVTLHDVPGADPDPARDARRGAGYARVIAACDGVIVSAEHEAAKVERLTGRVPHMVELPIEPLPDGGVAPEWAGRTTLGVLGFVHPGKGHAAAIDAAARTGAAPLVVALGAVAPGHDELYAALLRRAAHRGVELLVTGPLTDADLAAGARTVTVALAPYRGVSASGSLATWLACGRRPLVARGTYACELERRRPGTLHLYEGDAALDADLRRGLADDTFTRLDGPPPRPDVGAAHVAIYRRLLGCSGWP